MLYLRVYVRKNSTNAMMKAVWKKNNNIKNTKIIRNNDLTYNTCANLSLHIFYDLYLYRLQKENIMISWLVILSNIAS